MDGETTPIYGWTQPALGCYAKLISEEVRQPKTTKIVSHQARQARLALGQNILRRLAHLYPHKAKTYGFERIQEETGLTLSTLQRITDGKVGPSVDTIANIAHNLGVSVAELMMEPKDGPTGKTAEPPPRRPLQRRTKS